MAPTAKRRRTSGLQASSKAQQQSQLSFRSSKAGLKKPQIKDEKPSKTPQVNEIPGEEEAEEVAPDESQPQPKPEIPEDLQGPSVEAEDEDEDEEQIALDKEALALPETKLKSYWASKERERKAPRIHQEGLSVRDKILREFDMSSRFGPSVGIQRLSRWRRAHDLGMDPPIEVLAVLLKEEAKAFKGAAGSRKDFQTSIIDELTLSSRLKANDLVEA